MEATRVISFHAKNIAKSESIKMDRGTRSFPSLGREYGAERLSYLASFLSD